MTNRVALSLACLALALAVCSCSERETPTTTAPRASQPAQRVEPAPDPTPLLTQLKERALSGDPKALYELGGCYVSGLLGSKTNLEAAVWCFDQAAQKGFAPAQLRLGQAYWRGIGVPRDPARAVHWFKEAAVQGETEAQHALGVCFLAGLGLAKDVEAGVGWLEKAAAAGHVESQLALAEYFCSREGAEDRATGLTWLKKAAEAGVVDAALGLGIAHLHGRGTETNALEAYKWLSVASRKTQRALAPLWEAEAMLTPEEVATAKELAAQQVKHRAE